MIDKLNDALAAYDTATGVVTAPPEWFVETMRSQGTRNITVETWNALCMNVRRLASNGAATDTLLKIFGELFNSEITEREKADTDIISALNNLTNTLNNEMAVREEADAKKLDKKEPSNPLPHVYTVGRVDSDDGYYEDGENPILRPGVSTPTPYAVVIRDRNGTFTVPNKPTNNAHPTSKLYVDTNNALLDEKVTDLQNDVAFLKIASEGSLYKTKHIHLENKNGGAEHIFGNALTHGVWNEYPSWSYNLSLAFECKSAVDRKNNKVGITWNSLTFPSTEKFYIYIPVNIPSDTTCKFFCDSYGADGDDVYKYNFLDVAENQIFTSNVTLGVSCTIPAGKTAKTLVLIKRNPGVSPSSDVLVKNLRLYVNNTSAYVYEYDSQLASKGYPESFVIYPSAKLFATAEGSDFTADFSYIEKLPEESAQ